jgi:hypothetical protein
MGRPFPVVASAVGGIQYPIVHGSSGMLLQHRFDLDEFSPRFGRC